MAVYLWLPPGSGGTSAPAGQPMSPPMRPAPMEPPGRLTRAQRPGCLRPGLFKSSNGSLPGTGDSGKCSPCCSSLTRAPARSPGVDPGPTPVFTRFPRSGADSCAPGLPAPWARARRPGPVDGTAESGQRPDRAPDGVKDVTASIILGPLGPGRAPPLCDSISLSWQPGVLFLLFNQS